MKTILILLLLLTPVPAPKNKLDNSNLSGDWYVSWNHSSINYHYTFKEDGNYTWNSFNIVSKSAGIYKFNHGRLYLNEGSINWMIFDIEYDERKGIIILTSDKYPHKIILTKHPE